MKIRGMGIKQSRLKISAGMGAWRIRLVAWMLVLCLICICAGCGDAQSAGSEDSNGSTQASESARVSSEGNESEDNSENNSGSESQSEDDLPGYLAACTAVDGVDNLSEFHADFLTDGEYDAVLLFGENLLFVRTYIDEDMIAADGADEYEYSENFCYQFALYSPEDNEVIATYDTKDDPIDYYQLAANRLLMIDYADYEIRIYDELLSYVDTYDASEVLEDSDGSFYPAGQDDSYYFMSYEDYRLKKAVFADDGIVVEECDTGFYCSYISGNSASGEKIAISTVNAETFFNEFVIVNTDDLTVEKTYSRTSAYFPYISDNAFLVGTDYTNDLYLYEEFDGDASYFTLSNMLTTLLLGDNIVVVQDALYEPYDDAYEEDEAESSASDVAENTASTWYTLCAYNGNGSYVSGFSYITDGNIYSVSDPIYLEQYDCAVVLMKDYGDYSDDVLETFMLVWDLSEKGEIPDETKGYVPDYLMMCASENVALAAKSSQTDSDVEDGTGDTEDGNTEDDVDSEYSGVIYGDTVTLVTDPDSYDWGDLQSVRKQADLLAEQYDIEIYLGPEIPTYISDYQTEQCLDTETIDMALDKLEEILALYPESLYPQLLYGDLEGIRIYLTGSIWGQGDYVVSQATAFVDEINDYAVLVADAWQYWDWNYTVNHEISHLIDRCLAFRSTYRKDSMFSEEVWSSYNSDGFEYANTYEDFSSLPWYDYTEYFLDEYGMTFATEDRAQLFGAAVSNYMDSDTYFWVFTEDSPLVQKLVYYCECIRADFDSEGWDSVLPWEAAVQE